ncbi:acyl-CoA dehydrogenase NM domain-like protein [Paxillus ammoniavirescens]|nr:acyl-CoA dehydrogenase NM domain-like protein [Paxillus ammoniavirescens]
MTPTFDANAQTSIDLKDARARVSIDLQSIRDYLFGDFIPPRPSPKSLNSRVNWETYERIENILRKEPVFDKSQRWVTKSSRRHSSGHLTAHHRRDFIGRVEAYKRALAITKRLTELERLHGWTKAEAAQAMSILSESLPVTLHDLAFEPVFVGQGSSDLLEEYWDIEFEIHSPSLTSTKWWVGGLGKTATHGIVQAKLILPGGKDMGPHLFLVQLRSLGITAGDIGPKAGGGSASLDNGYARFDRVRIPRKNMFSKFAEVTENGEYTKPLNPRHSFGGMMYIRARFGPLAPILAWSRLLGGPLQEVRLPISRRITSAQLEWKASPSQFVIPPSDDREKLMLILDWSAKLSHTLPLTIASFLSSRVPMFSSDLVAKRLTEAFSTSGERIEGGDFAHLAEIHATLCGLKRSGDR